MLRNLRERDLINACAYSVAPGYIVGLRLLHSDLLPTPVRAIDHRLAAKLQDAKSQLQELAAVHDAAELREAHACFQRVCSSFDTWPWSYLLWPWSNLFWLWSCLFWPWPCQNKMYRTRAKRLAFEFVRARTGGLLSPDGSRIWSSHRYMLMRRFGLTCAPGKAVPVLGKMKRYVCDRDG